MKRMEPQEEDRAAYVQEVEKYLQQYQDDMADILKTLSWTPKHFLKTASATCSVDSSHQMPVGSLEKHTERCLLGKRGYSWKELSLLPSSSFYYEKSPLVETQTIDRETLNSVLRKFHSDMKTSYPGDREVPLTIERATCEFSPQERLVLYEHHVMRAQKIKANKDDDILAVDFEGIVKKSVKGDAEAQPKNALEEIAAMRDYKRRRQTYRAKNVHITKKSYTEIIREVINNQVEFVQQTMKDAEKEEKSSERAEHRSAHKRREYNSSSETEVRESRHKHRKRYRHRADRR